MYIEVYRNFIHRNDATYDIMPLHNWASQMISLSI